ncbi:MAG: dimethylarginine dimethylaminohydrolase family protein [Flammeovirgaceae bacterium]
MKSTCHSEFGKLKSIIIKPAAAAFVSEQHVQQYWRALNFLAQPNLNLAQREYLALENLVRSTGATVFSLPLDDTVTMDSIYCRDATIATDFGMIVLNMGKPARTPEPAAQQRQFEKFGLQVLGAITTPGTLEGGDVAWLDERTLAVGHTYRTNPEGIRQLKNLLEPKGIEVVVAHMPHYKGPSDVFHLMSVLSPVDKDLAVVYSPLMPIAFRNELIDRGFSFIEVPDSEWDSMGCNILAIAPREVVMVKGNPQTKQGLLEAGCVVHEYDGQEISVKGGGGPTCLTRPIERWA